MDALMILIAGPYRSGTGDDPVKLAGNAQAMNDAALRTGGASGGADRMVERARAEGKRVFTAVEEVAAA